MDEIDKQLRRIGLSFKRNASNFYYEQLKRQGIKRKHVGRYEIPLGFSDREGKGQLIKLPLKDGKPKCMLISSGRRGSGKSRLMSLIAMDNICERFNVPSVFVDPKHELRTHAEPHDEFAPLFDKIGMKPKGVSDLLPITPSSLIKKGFDDGSIEYALDSSNLTYEDLITILNVEGSTGDAARSQLQMLIYGDMTDKTWEEFKETKIPSIDDLIKRAVGSSNRAPMDSRLIRELMNSKHRGALQPNKYLDIVNLVSKGKNIIMQTSLSSDTTDCDTSAYIAHALRAICEDRASFVDSKGVIGKIKKPVQFVIEEFNIPFPRIKNPSSKIIINKVYGQMRYAGVSITAACPSFHDIDPSAIKQSDYIFAFQTTDEAERRLLFRRVGRDENKIRILERLNYSVNRHPRGQCAMIGPDGDITCFYPIQPFSLPQGESTAYGDNVSEGFY